MGWAVFRLLLFLTAFVVGALFTSLRTAIRNDAAPRETHGRPGASLVVVCEHGPATVSKFRQDQSVIKVDCIQSRILAARWMLVSR